MKLRVLLIGVNLRAANENAGKVYQYFSLGLHKVRAYALADASVADACEIDIRDYSIYDDAEEIVQYIIQQAPDVVGFSIYFWNWSKVCAVVPRIRASLPRARVILGGTEVSTEPIELIREHPFLDILVKGEGEIAFREVLRRLAADPSARDLRDVKGLVFHLDDQIVETPNNSLIMDLDSIPTPYRGGALREAELSNYVPLVETMRGCPWDCSYCAWTTVKLRYYSAERVCGEIDYLASMGSKRIMICDADFGLNRKTFKRVLRHLIENHPDVRLAPFFIVEGMPTDDEEFLELLNGGIIVGVDIGLQSVNPRAIKDMKRPFNKERFEKKYFRLRDLADRKFDLAVDLIYGLPGDDFEGFRESCRYVLDTLTPEQIALYPLQIFRGSPLFKAKSHYQIVMDPRSPTLVAESYSFSRDDMRRAEMFANAVQAEQTFRLYFKDLHAELLAEVGLGRFEAVEMLYSLFESSPDLYLRFQSVFFGQQPIMDVASNKSQEADWDRCRSSIRPEIAYSPFFVSFLDGIGDRRGLGTEWIETWQTRFRTSLFWFHLMLSGRASEASARENVELVS